MVTEKIHDNERITITHDTTRQEELWKLLNDTRFPSDWKEYNGSFDDGNHPGGSTDYDIKEKSDNIIVDIDERTDKETLNRVEEHQELLRIENIILPRASKNQTTSLLIKQEKIEQGSGFRNKTVGSAIPVELLNLGEILVKDNEIPSMGTKCIYITFTPTQKKPLTIDIAATIVEYPNIGSTKKTTNVALIPEYVVFRRKLEGREINELLKKVA